MNHNAIEFKYNVKLTIIISIVLAVSLLIMLGCVYSDGMELWIFWICFFAIELLFIIIFIYSYFHTKMCLGIRMDNLPQSGMPNRVSS